MILRLTRVDFTKPNLKSEDALKYSGADKLGNIPPMGMTKPVTEEINKDFLTKKDDGNNGVSENFQTEEQITSSIVSGDEKDNKIVFAVSRKEFFKVKDKVKEIIAQYIKKGKEVGLVIDGADSSIDAKSRTIEYSYSKEETKQLCDFNEYLKDAGMKEDIRFSELFEVNNDREFEECWTLKQVLKANGEIKDVVAFIKKNKFSPFEAMVYIHKYVSSLFSYSNLKEDEQFNRSTENARNIVYAYEHFNIVCAGFSSLVKAIIDELGDPNLSCEYLSIDVMKDLKMSGHACNKITIHDEKYDIDGQYREDTCWDCKSEDFKEGTFAFCMQPMQEFYSFLDGKDFRSSAIGGRLASMGILSFVDMLVRPNSSVWGEKDAANPIPLQKFKKAFEIVYASEGDLDDYKRRRKIEKIIKSSFMRAVATFKRDAKNSFVIEASESGVYSDKKFILDLISKEKDSSQWFEYVDEEIKKDKNFIIELLRKNQVAVYVYMFMDETLKKDGDFMIELIKASPFMFKFIDNDLKRDTEFVRKLLDTNPILLHIAFLSGLGEDKDFMLSLIKIRPEYYNTLSKKLKNDREINLQAVKNDVSLIRTSPYKDDENFVADAVEANSELWVIIENEFSKHICNAVVKILNRRRAEKQTENKPVDNSSNENQKQGNGNQGNAKIVEEQKNIDTPQNNSNKNPDEHD